MAKDWVGNASARKCNIRCANAEENDYYATEPKAVELLLRNLDKLEPTDDNKKIAILNQSIERGWKTVYPINDNAEEKAASTDIEEYKAVINDFLY